MRGNTRAALLAIALLAGCTEPSAPPADPPAAPVRGGTLVMGSISDVDAWNEAVSAQSFAANLHRLLFLRLAREKRSAAVDPVGFDPELGRRAGKRDVDVYRHHAGDQQDAKPPARACVRHVRLPR